MRRLYIRARMINAWRRLFPHAAVVAQRERRRVALQAQSHREIAKRGAILRRMREMQDGGCD